MSRPATLNDAAHAALVQARRSPKESLSAVILRHVPAPIETFADLEAHLSAEDRPLVVDMPALDRILARKRAANHAD